jgi:hypothetical protein
MKQKNFGPFLHCVSYFATTVLKSAIKFSIFDAIVSLLENLEAKCEENEKKNDKKYLTDV